MGREESSGGDGEVGSWGRIGMGVDVGDWVREEFTVAV